MGSFLRSVAFAAISLVLATPCFAASNPSNVLYVPSIAVMQALGPASGQIPVVVVTDTQGDGSQFLWTTGSLPCNSVSGGGDGGTTFCASNGSTGFRTDGYWQRQGVTSFVKDVWFGILRDGATNNATAFGKWLTACSGKQMLETTGTAIFNTPASTYVPPANCEWHTVPGASDVFNPAANVSGAALFSQQNANFSITGFGTITFNVPFTGSDSNPGFMDFIDWKANNLSLSDVTINGGMADNGTAITTGKSRLLYVNASDATGLTIRDVTAPNFQAGYAKLGFGTTGSTCDTSTQNKIRIDHLVMTNVYAFGLNFNSPCGSQSNIKITNSSFTSAAQTPLLAVSSAPVGIGFASGKDIVVDGNTVNGAFLDFYHLEQDVQNVKIVNNHCEVPSGVTGNTNRCLDVIPADIQTGLVFKHPVHGEVAHNTANLVGSTTGATAMAFGVWVSTASTSDTLAEDFDFHDNIAYGAWPFGYYDQATHLADSVSFHDNLADGATTGMFVQRGGSGVYNNTSKNCTTGLLYSVAQIQSHNFNGCTQTLAGAASTSVLWIGTLRWDFAPVSLAASASQTYELLDFDASNARLTGLPTATTTSTDGTSRTFNYVGGTNNSMWDGTTYANANTLNVLTSLASTGTGVASSFAHGTSSCPWGSPTSCFNFSLVNNAGTTQSVSATVTVMGGAYIRKGQ